MRRICGQISLDTLIRQDSATRWQPASSILGGRKPAPPAGVATDESLAIQDRPVPIGYVIAGAAALVLVLLLFLLLFLGCLAGRLSLFSGNGDGNGNGDGRQGGVAADENVGIEPDATDSSAGGPDDASAAAFDGPGPGSVASSTTDTLTQDDSPTGNFTISPLGQSPDAPAEPSASGASGGGVTGGVGGLSGVGGSGAGGTGGMSEFFGAKARGNRFVYIIDQSGSMAGGRFERACDELLKAVNDLSGRQQFYVYFFTTGTRVMFDDTSAPQQLQRSTTRNRERLEEWVRSLYANGGNGAEAGTISAALELDPDAIYFLSDGGFDLNTADIVRENNIRARADQYYWIRRSQLRRTPQTDCRRERRDIHVCPVIRRQTERSLDLISPPRKRPTSGWTPSVAPRRPNTPGGIRTPNPRFRRAKLTTARECQNRLARAGLRRFSCLLHCS